jgi:hypothetical protein
MQAGLHLELKVVVGVSVAAWLLGTQRFDLCESQVH